MATTTQLDALDGLVRQARVSLDDLSRGIRYLRGDALAGHKTVATDAAAVLATASTAIDTATAAL